MPAFAFTSSTLFNLDVDAQVQYSPATRNFKYSYSVNNHFDSQQDIATFGMKYEKLNFLITSPVNWHAFPQFGDNVIIWGRLNEEARLILPGSSQTGFALTSPSLPAIQPFYAQSSYVYQTEDEQEQEEIDKKDLTAYFNNVKTSSTVGPGPDPITDPVAMVKYLIDLKHKSLDMGWISKTGIIVSLDAKLDAAQASITRGQKKTAANQVRSFIQELEAQNGKSVNGSAFGLLKANAEYLLSLL